MARGAMAALDGVARGGIVVCPDAGDSPPSGLQIYIGGHPLPNEGSIRAATAIADWARDLGENDLVLFLVSGGGSALISAPAGSLTPADLEETTRLLLKSGASIEAFNTVRRHLTTLQGGRLAALLSPATVITLAISDVVGNQIETIASGPTVPSPTSIEDALKVLKRRGLWPLVSAAVRAHIEGAVRGDIAPAPKSGDSAFERSMVRILGSGRSFLAAAAAVARDRHWRVVELAEPVVGEARDVGRKLGRNLREISRRTSATTVLVGAGETTVTLQGNSGRGGRNQELALAAALELSETDRLSLASFATDGVDGPTDAAGAIVDGETVRRAKAAGLDPSSLLKAHNSYPPLAAAGDLIHTGPTGTNVADVVLGFVSAAKT
jgi:hydroxypyruvate reductase